MQTITAGQFKAKCLAIMDEVQSKREPVIITKNGKPVARLEPIVDEQ
jgi:prevent-host-death family protein